jgi:hypothetical protein
MTNRTLVFLGQGFGSTTVDIAVTANDEVVYTGPVNTLDEPLPQTPYLAEDCATLFTMEIPVDFAGTIPMTMTVNSGYGIKFVVVWADYVIVPNPVYTAEQFAVITGPDWDSQEAQDIITSLANPPFTSEELAVLENPDTPDDQCEALLTAHGVETYVSGGDGVYNGTFWPGDSRTNVTLNGNPCVAPDPRPPGLEGDWTWSVPVDGILSYDLNINAGVE